MGFPAGVRRDFGALEQRLMPLLKGLAPNGKLCGVRTPKTEDQRLEKDPGLRVEQAILLVFRKFADLGTVQQTLMWFLEHGLETPARTPRGETCW